MTLTKPRILRGPYVLGVIQTNTDRLIGFVDDDAIGNAVKEPLLGKRFFHYQEARTYALFLNAVGRYDRLGRVEALGLVDNPVLARLN